ncbi:MAG TPA: hypothetical protein VJA47_00655 [archaeon]|nr:hypothetical protein [archaeon]
MDFIIKITCDRVDGDTVYEAIKSHKLESDVVFSNIRVFEVGLNKDNRCTECRELINSISPILSEVEK